MVKALSKVYLGLGSNLGDRFANLLEAKKGLGENVLITDESEVYETEPWGVEDQPDFLNMCVTGQTELDPFALLRFVKRLERKLGREPSVRWGPRLIDIDILFYDQLVMDVPGLSIPHKGVSERATVLVPMADIAPDLQHPVHLKTIGDLLLAVDMSGVHLYSNQ